MTKQEKKQLKNIISIIENAQANISLMLVQEEERLEPIENSISQIDRAIKLESNIGGLESAEEALGEAIESLENIL